ncbi:hypothetical protein KIPB_005940 [Kipferlia bialata]|uniref:Uncharacterized protein n=1 Tax=Kipferlia bialata TaxID=797122 RepID=A0A9K3GHT8_9EUKA|nr:hypothetical protein KIPB_005940 [Kipferlia bialata]|eukprot:g5940.t1
MVMKEWICCTTFYTDFAHYLSPSRWVWRVGVEGVAVAKEDIEAMGQALRDTLDARHGELTGKDRQYYSDLLARLVQVCKDMTPDPLSLTASADDIAEGISNSLCAKLSSGAKAEYASQMGQETLADITRESIASTGIHAMSETPLLETAPHIDTGVEGGIPSGIEATLGAIRDRFNATIDTSLSSVVTGTAEWQRQMAQTDTEGVEGAGVALMAQEHVYADSIRAQTTEYRDSLIAQLMVDAEGRQEERGGMEAEEAEAEVVFKAPLSDVEVVETETEENETAEPVEAPPAETEGYAACDYGEGEESVEEEAETEKDATPPPPPPVYSTIGSGIIPPLVHRLTGDILCDAGLQDTVRERGELMVRGMARKILEERERIRVEKEREREVAEAEAEAEIATAEAEGEQVETASVEEDISSPADEVPMAIETPTLDAAIGVLADAIVSHVNGEGVSLRDIQTQLSTLQKQTNKAFNILYQQFDSFDHVLEAAEEEDLRLMEVAQTESELSRTIQRVASRAGERAKQETQRLDWGDREEEEEREESEREGSSDREGEGEGDGEVLMDD